MLWNLLSNAVKFTPDGGRISVSAAQIDDRIRIEVTDTGIGIEPAFLPHVFDRFRQADSATTRRYGGLGLGLAIVHDLVRLHGGDVEVRSAGVGQGATFVVTLPASLRGARRARTDARARARPSAWPATASCCSRITTTAGSSSASAWRMPARPSPHSRPPAQALAALEHVRPSVIVADIGLPDEDGYSFIRRVRRHSSPAMQAIPAIAVTAYATEADRAMAFEAGFQQHLTKPVDPDELVDAIHSIARSRRRRA